MSNCLTVIQNRAEYYCSLRTPEDIHNLQEQLETPKSQDQAESVHLILHHPKATRNRPAFFQLMQVIGQLPNLREISISMLHTTTGTSTRKLPSSAVAVLLRRAKKLQILHLEDITLEESPYELAEVLKCHPTLHTVHLLRCYCSPVHVLLQALGKMPHLQSLTLDGSILALQHDADALAALVGICHSQSLQSLHLEELEENSMIQPLIVMMDALRQQTIKLAGASRLTELSLHLAIHESMPLIVVRAMASMLLSNTSLQTIVVPWTGGGEVWLPIIEALRYNTTLQQFRLHPMSPVPQDSHCLSHHFLQRAASMLRNDNTQLSYLWYDDWEPIDLEIDLYIKSNKLGRRHLLSYDERPTHDEWVRALVSSRDSAHVSYFWLTQNPSLLVSAAAKTA